VYPDKSRHKMWMVKFVARLLKNNTSELFLNVAVAMLCVVVNCMHVLELLCVLCQ